MATNLKIVYKGEKIQFLMSDFENLKSGGNEVRNTCNNNNNNDDRKKC